MSNKCSFVQIDLPYPISANAMYMVIPKLKMPVPTAAYKKYKIDVRKHWLQVRQQCKFETGEAVMLWSIVFPPRRNCDIDNINKTLFDSLASEAGKGAEPDWRGAFTNDKYIVSTHQEKAQRVADGMVRVFIAAECHREELNAVYWQQANAGIAARVADTGKIVTSPRPVVVLNPVPR